MSKAVRGTQGEMAYRFGNHQISAGVNEFDNPLGPGQTHIYCNDYEVLSHTPKGFWISYLGGKRFVLKDAKKCFVHLTQQAALESFIKRKYRQISILSSQIRSAETAIRLAKIRLDKQDKTLL